MKFLNQMSKIYNEIILSKKINSRLSMIECWVNKGMSKEENVELIIKYLSNLYLIF